MSALNGTLVIAERTSEGISRQSIEVIACAQKLGGPLRVVFTGAPGGADAEQLRSYRVDEVVSWPAPGQAAGLDADAYGEALARLVTDMKPEHVLLPQSYAARDYAPRLAASLGVTLVSDCIAIEREDNAFVYLRQMFQGRFHARVRVEGEGPRLVSMQSGACRIEEAIPGEAPAPVTSSALEAAAQAIRVHVEPPFRETSHAVDLTRARIIVAVGRGIKAQENIAMVRRLADLLGAEVAASRAVCDEGWLPIERQVGSSGQTVSPALYIALGISGAVQHLVGMKTAETIVAVNKDASAPIFKIADYGIVGDLFEVVPALISALEAR